MGILNKLGNLFFKGLLSSAEVECLNPYIGLLLKADEEDLIADELYRLSLAFQYGEYGLTTDENRALHYCKMAAERGHEVAQLFYAMWLMRKPDDASPEVLYWLQKAAEQGERQSLYNLGISIHRGDISGKDPIKESLPLFRKAAELGYAPSYSRMAWIYYDGEGVEKNNTIAKYWAWLDYAQCSSEEEREKSIFNNLVEENDIIKIAEPTDESSKYAINHKKIIEDAAKVGEPDALNNWGTGLFKTDKQKGMELQQQAIDLGHKIAACNMGKHLWVETIKDYSNAIILFQSSAEWGCAEAQYSLAVMYGEGLGTPKDLSRAWYWLEKSLNKGCNDARRYFAHLIMTNQLQDILPDKVMRGPSYLELSGNQE